MEEIWKSITGYDGAFEVSNFDNFRSKDRMVQSRWGKPRSYKGKPLKLENTLDGYLRISLMQNSIKTRYLCHRLVAQESIPNPDNKPFVNHLNRNRSDNRVENLEQCTQSENELYSIKTFGNTQKGKTFPKKIKCVDNDIIYSSMSEVIRNIGGKACISGLVKSINANRLYYGHKYLFI